MDTYTYIMRNGKNMWGKGPFDYATLDRGRGFDGTPIRTDDKLADLLFEADQRRTREQNIAIVKEKNEKGEL